MYRTLYIGGGTPSLLSLEQLSTIKRTLDGSFDMSSLEEFTMEVNPDDIVKNGLRYAEGLIGLGANRVSMGVQSFDDDALYKMGRRHDARQAEDAYSLLRHAGFKNISIDLIFGFNSSLDLDKIRCRLENMGLPEHISCYQLSIEEGSGLDRMVQKGHYTMPPDEECERQYYGICDMLRELGYEHYEISNWARPGFQSRHNSAYWDHTPYLGFGPGAHSLIISPEGQYSRRWNNPDVARYIGASVSGDWASVRGGEILTDEQIRQERLFLGLRTAKGVDECVIPEDKWFISDSIIADML